jgi:dihydropteroate synthase
MDGIGLSTRTTWQLGERTLGFRRPLGVGIVNVTEDSFWEGARSKTAHEAIVDGQRMIRAGFDLLDVGAVAARSGAPVPPDEEAERLVPAVEGLARERRVPITVDTFSPQVASEALEAGADAINDIGGGADPAMLELVADSGCGLVIMHIEGPPRTERDPPDYDDPVEHMKRWFSERVEAALGRGVAEDQIAIDPGFDFDLSVDDDLEVLRRLAELHELGRPLFVSLSRKDFLGAVLTGSWERRAPAERREWATAAAVTLAVAAGAHMLRIHDVSALDAMLIAHRVVNG